MTEGPIDPVDLGSMIFTTADGVRRIGTPNEREQVLAERLVADRVMWSRGFGAHSLATILAAVREGSTLDGPRSQVHSVAVIPRQAAEDPGSDAVAIVTRSLWRRWVDELTERGMRPVGWPTMQRTHLAYGAYGARPYRSPGTGAVPDGHPWDLLELRIECEAVPI